MKYNSGWRNIQENNKTMSTDEARRRGHIGGVNSGKARRERKTMREDVAFILGLLISVDQECDAEEVQAIAEMNDRNITVQQACILQQVHKALNGDLKALEFLRDISGEQQIHKIELSEREKIEEGTQAIERYFRDASDDETTKAEAKPNQERTKNEAKPNQERTKVEPKSNKGS